MENVSITTHGNYRCDFCTKTWKRSGSFITKHLECEHKDEVLLANAQRETRRLNEKVESLKSQLVLSQKLVQKAERPRYDAVVYCPTCQSVDSVKIVKGFAPGETGCWRCGGKGCRPLHKSM